MLLKLVTGTKKKQKKLHLRFLKITNQIQDNFFLDPNKMLSYKNTNSYQEVFRLENGSTYCKQSSEINLLVTENCLQAFILSS